ncbi:organic cation transporter protein isoform X1 [Nematostella vectensis]|uniref:organic cation transporter protein isoform X1 n=1 Tax=Nematostella vectensis TaxID=45351 RepID=UPI002077162C|nr:organic cation transporter protein isoform X1 [Nematostella vectensis]
MTKIPFANITMEAESQRTACTFDDIFKHVNSFGRYPQMMYFAFSFGFIFTMEGQFSGLVFLMGTPRFHCATPNITCSPNTCCNNCTEYEFDGPMRTTVSEWSLICGRAYLGTVLQACDFSGMVLGSLISGNLSDRLGRKKWCLYSAIILLISSTSSSFVDCPSFFAFLRFVVGMSTISLALAQYTYCLEAVGPEWRTMAGSAQGFFWNGNSVLAVLAAYLVRYWRNLILVYSTALLPILFAWKWIPESPRWLVAHGYVDEAYSVIMKYGPKKGKESVDSAALRDLIQNIHQDQIKEEKEAKIYNYMDLLRGRKLRKWSCILFYQWFSVALVTFGMYLFVEQLAGNLFVNYTIMRTVTTLRVFINWIVYGKFGRRFSHGVFQVMTGLILLLILAVYKDYPKVTTGLGLAGSILSANWSGLYLITSEIYPTVIRNSGLSAGSTVARIGAVLSPFIVMTGRLPGLSTAFPVSIFGTMAVTAGLSTYLLPETLFLKMCQTIKETEVAQEYYGLPCWGKSRDTDERAQAEIEGKEEITRL